MNLEDCAWNTLCDILHHSRPETIPLAALESQPFVITKNTSISRYVVEYVDLRDGRTREFHLYRIPSHITFGAPLCRRLISNLETERDQLVDRKPLHLLILCKKSSNKCDSLFAEMMDTVWEVLTYEELRFNKLKSVLVPDYELVHGEDDYKSALEHLGTEDLSKVARIKAREDAVARLMGMRHGDLFRKVVPHGLAGYVQEYRCAHDRLEDNDDEDDAEE